MVVASIIGYFRPVAANVSAALIPGIMKWGLRTINRCKRARAMRTTHIGHHARIGVNWSLAKLLMCRNKRP
jgi:hypothetical protein